MTDRINVRVDPELYEIYAAAARLQNLTVPELVRRVLQTAAPGMVAYVQVWERAAAGDQEAAAQLITTLMAAHQGNLDMARELGASLVASRIAEQGAASSGACSASNTAR